MKTLIKILLVFAFTFNANASADKPDSNRSLWVANALLKINQRQDYYDLALLKFTLESYNHNPASKKEDVLSILNELKTDYQKESNTSASGYKVPVDFSNAIESMYTVLSADPRTRYVAAFLKEGTQWGVKTAESNASSGVQMNAQKDIYATYNYIQDELDQQKFLETLWTRGQDSKTSLGSVVDTFFAPSLNATLHDSAESILAKNSDLRLIRTVEKTQQQSTATAELVALASNELGNISKLTSQSVDKTTALQQEMRTRQEAQNRKREEKQQEQLSLDAAKSSVYLVSTALSFKDPKLANVVRVVGGSAIQTAESLIHFNETTQGVAKLGSTLGSVALTGNLVGIAVNLVSILGSAGPTADEIILRQLGGLREQVDMLGKVMESRFDRVDTRLVQIYQALGSQLYQITGLIHRSNQNIADVQEHLNVLRGELFHVEDRINSKLVAGFNRQFAHDRATCKRTSNDYSFARLSLNEFIACTEKFQTYSNELSKDGVVVEETTRTLDDPMLAKILTAKPEVNFGLLAALGKKMFNHPFFPESPNFANPIEWAASADIYIDLLAKNWDQFARLAPMGITQAIRSEGKKLADFEASIFSRDNSDFAKSLIENYRKTIQDLSEHLISSRKEFQETEYKLPETIAPCEKNQFGSNYMFTPNLAYPMPSGIESFIPENFKTASLLGLGKLEVCISMFGYSSVKGTDRLDGRLVIAGFYENEVVFIQAFVPNERLQRSDIFNGMGARDYSALVGRIFFDPAKPLLAADHFAHYDWIESGLPQAFGHPENRKKLEESIGKKTQEKLGGVDGAFLRSLFLSSKFDSLTNRVSNARSLLIAYISLAFPETLELDDEFRGLITGSDRIESGDDIKAGLSKPDLAKFLASFKTLSDQKTALFLRKLNTIVRTRKTSEMLPVVKNTLNRLDVLLAQQEAVHPKLPIDQAVALIRVSLKKLKRL